MRHLPRETIKMLFIHILLAEEFFYLGFELRGGSRVISIERLLKHEHDEEFLPIFRENCVI